VPKRYYDLFWFVFWLIVTCLPLYHYVIYVLVAASLLHKVIVIVVFSVSK